jgi:hypothetical protein
MGPREFKMYHKNQPLLDGLATTNNIYAILVSDKEKMYGDIQHTSIITQWDAINYLLKFSSMKTQGILDFPARKVMQGSWITFTKNYYNYLCMNLLLIFKITCNSGEKFICALNY